MLKVFYGVIASVISGIALPVLAADCHWQEELEQILVDDAPRFYTLAALEQLDQRCPNQPRVLLEQGDALFQLRHYEEASLLWRRVLEQHELPDAVALKVRLRVLDAEKRAKDRLQHTIIVRSSARWDHIAQDVTLDWSTHGVLSYGFPGMPLLGDPIYSSSFVKYGALLRQHYPQNTDETYLTISAGFDNRYRMLALPIGIGWESMTGSSTVSVNTKPSLRWKRWVASNALEWNLETLQWEQEPELRWATAQTSVSTSATWSEVWQQVDFSLSHGRRWQLGLGGQYDLNGDSHEVESSLRVKPVDSLTLRVQADTNPIAWEQWSTSFSISWEMP